MAYHTLTLTAAAAALVERGSCDLPQEDLPGAERCEPGQPLRLVSPAGNLLSLAVADPENQLVRAMARPEEGVSSFDAAFFRGRVRQALALRAAFGLRREETTHRVLNAAGDGLPGLAADVYGQYAVLYAYARGLLTLGRVLAGDPDQVVGAAGSFVPRFGSRKSVRGAVTFCVKSNMFMMLPAVASKDPPPIR